MNQRARGHGHSSDEGELISNTETLTVENLVKHYKGAGGAVVHALDGVSFTVAPGETLGIVGESGCGKSTLARLLVRLEHPTSGRVLLGDTELTALGPRAMRPYRRRVQLVFQDPYASLHPRLTVEQTLAEVLGVHGLSARGAERSARVTELMEMVGLPSRLRDRYPVQLSGGQRQRVGIARALAVEPDVLILDEAVSALDVSVQAEVMNLLVRLRERLNLTYLFISHDLAMVRHISDRVLVLYLGKVAEVGPWREVSDEPLHPYARSLRDAGLVPDPSRRTPAPMLGGEVPNAARPPAGCRFHPRCPVAEDRCRTDEPALLELRPGHQAACHVAADAATVSPI
ncbi:dipeptide ABC transporter ATP-binding protein [Actinoallomurus oryzae]|uniref:Dipeptide ABC transporter ATP-binding protein n=1 Tax=Actinoallomurus oryzae TaxID=502180 RepID=A0ABP8R8Y1_9ACTN